MDPHAGQVVTHAGPRLLENLNLLILIVYINFGFFQMMEKLGLEFIGRNYYDPAAASLVREYCLEVWPGYITSIRQHENSIMLCAEVSNKRIRTDTVFEQMGVIYQRRPPNFKVGSI